jgi:uncharacterized protein YdcH (DUF465 family)
MSNIFDKTESLIKEFGEIKAHNARFKALYEELCNDDLLKHYKTFTGSSREHIMEELERIEKSIKAIEENLTPSAASR